MGRKPGSKNKEPVSKLPKYIQSGVKLQEAPVQEPIKEPAKPAPAREPESWWSESAAVKDINALLTGMEAKGIYIFKREDADLKYHGTGMIVCFSRFGVIQYVECGAFRSTEVNLRQVYLFIKKLQWIETQGINYGSLSTRLGSSIPMPADFNVVLP